MAKKPSVTTITSGYASNTQLNGNFAALRNAFDNTLSLDGSTPNAMGADLDLNSNDILNVNALEVVSIRSGGEDIDLSGISTLAPIADEIVTLAQLQDGTVLLYGLSDLHAVKDEIVTLAPSSSSIPVVAAIDSEVVTVAGISSSVTTVAANITGVTSFAEKYRVGASDPSTSLDEGDLFYNTTSNQLKVYNGAAWDIGVTPGSGFLTSSNNLSELTNTATARTNIGLGSANNVTFAQVDITGTGDLRLQDTTGGQFVALHAPSTIPTSYTLTLPASDGTNGQVLQTNGSGGLSFGSPASTITKTYDNRADLRSIDGPASVICVVESLGVFVWESGSTQIDDDETCFATSSGRWLLYAAAWDLVSEYVGTELDVFSERILTGQVYNSTTSIGVNGTVSFTATVIGALVGDVVAVNPPAGFDARLIINSRVSATNIVTIDLGNASNNFSRNVSPGFYNIIVTKGL